MCDFVRFRRTIKSWARARKGHAMKSLRGGLVTMLAAGALVVLPTVNPRSTRVVSRPGPPDPKALYSRTEKEFWLSADEFGYVRPGFNITVNSITIDCGPSSGRGCLLHRRSRPAARSSRKDHAGPAVDQLRAGLVGRRGAPIHLVHHARPDQPDHERLGHAGGGRFRRDVGGRGSRARDLHVQDRAARRDTTGRRPTRSASTRRGT